MWRILVVDDEEGIRTFIAKALENVGYKVSMAADGEEALQLITRNFFHLIISDQKMPKMDGLTLLKHCKMEAPESEFIMLTAYGSIDSAVEAMKLGAFDYLTKPIESLEELRLIVARALERFKLKNIQEVSTVQEEKAPKPDYVSNMMKNLMADLQKVAQTDASVLLIGESGTGKEVLANTIHHLSSRSNAPFVAVNCAALSEQLLESELFGHERGSFTGATQSRRGRFELADGGTIFLDEIAELKTPLQAKLLRVLQERQFERVGGTKTINVDVRIISATNCDLAKEIKAGNFRADLYHHLATFPLRVPPLRERPADIIPLANTLLERICANLKREQLTLSQQAKEALLSYSWPGNIRELANVLERASIIGTNSTIEARELLFGIPEINTELSSEPSSENPADNANTLSGQLPINLKELEKMAIIRALEQNGGHRKESAEVLGIGLRTLYEKLKEYGIS